MRKSWIIACVLMVLLQACRSVDLPPIVGTSTSNVTQESPVPLVNKITQVPATIAVSPTNSPHPTTPAPIISRTPVHSTPSPTLTQTMCMQAGGRVDVYEITTVLLPTPLVYRIYLPPCYDEHPEQYYPVLYLIHGQTYSDTQWDRLGAPEIADRLIATGESVSFIIVMPRDRVWLEPTEDNFGLAVEQSLIPWVDEHYRTIPDRDHRAVGGLSRGGAWAIHLGLSHPELFSAVGVHSGFVFHSDVQPLHLWLYNMSEGMAPRISMDIADSDRPEIAESAIWLEEILTQFDIPHEWHMYVGEHEEAYWKSHLEDYLRWYSMEWGN